MSETLHVGGVPNDTADQQLSELFATAGQVVHAQVMRDAASGLSRGFGLVEMATPEETETALAALTGRTLNGGTITVRRLPPRATGWEGRNNRGGSNRSHGFGAGNGGSRW